MNVKDAIKARHAIKLYKDAPEASDKDIEAITDAAHLAPTPSNLQNSKVLVFRGKDNLAKLSQFFPDNNIENVKGAQAVFLMIGTPWEMESENNGEHIYEKSIKYYDAPEEVKRAILEGTKGYYDNYSPYVHQLDIYSSAIQFSFMVLQATELGYESTPMLGIYKDQLEDFLVKNKYIKKGETVNMALSIGVEDKEHPTNQMLKRIREPKELMIEEIKIK